MNVIAQRLHTAWEFIAVGHKVSVFAMGLLPRIVYYNIFISRIAQARAYKRIRHFPYKLLVYICAEGVP